MKLSLYRTLNHKNLLLLISIMSGYSFWSIIHNSQIGSLQINAPVFFYNISDNIKIESPTNIILKIYGPRKSIKNLNTSSLSIFLDAQKLKIGENIIELNKQHLLLPIDIEIALIKPPIIKAIKYLNIN